MTLTSNITKETLLDLYYQLKYPRLIEEKMLLLIRQGKVSKWFSGIGQEAISVGCTAALADDEMIFTMHRNLGVFTTRNVPLEQLILQWQGKEGGFTKGRDRSFHFGAPQYHIVGMISHLGPQLSLAAGVALAYKLKDQKKVSLAFTGDGATSQGEFHEALNTAAVWKLPVIFVIENNGYGLSTPINEQYACENLADRGIGYGMESCSIDGNDILTVYTTIKDIAASLRKQPRPYLVECKTFRMRGHEEASGVKYVPPADLEMWAERDPIISFEKHLLAEGLITQIEINSYEETIKKKINEAHDVADSRPAIVPNLEKELGDVYAPYEQINSSTSDKETAPTRYIDAIKDGIDQAMKRHSDLVLMGQDIAEYGGVFKITEGFAAKYGKDRVRNTPLCESAIVGIACGLSIEGIKSMVEMQFGDFVTCAFNQITNNLAKLNYRWGQAVDVVIRMPAGGGIGAGPFHSQTNEAWFVHTPGLKVVYPSNPYDAKGLLLAAFDDPNPVIYFEHKALYRSLTEEVPTSYYTIPIGKGNVIAKGNKIAIITYGMGVHWAKELATTYPAQTIYILDLRSLAPLDYDAIREAVLATNKVIVLHEDNLTGGIGGDISAYISEHLFEYLDAPVIRVASLDTPIPFSQALEQQYLPKDRLAKAVERLIKY